MKVIKGFIEAGGEDEVSKSSCGGTQRMHDRRTPSYMTALRYSALLLITGMLLVVSMPNSGFSSPLMSCWGWSSFSAILRCGMRDGYNVAGTVSGVRMLVGEGCDVIVQILTALSKYVVLSNAV